MRELRREKKIVCFYETRLSDNQDLERWPNNHFSRSSRKLQQPGLIGGSLNAERNARPNEALLEMISRNYCAYDSSPNAYGVLE